MPPSQTGSEEEMDEERRQAVAEALLSLSQQVARGSPEAVPVTSPEVEEMLQETQEARLDKLSMAAELLIKCGEHLLKGDKASEKEGKKLLEAVQENIKSASPRSASRQATLVPSPARSIRASSQASSQASSRASLPVIPAQPRSGISATMEGESR